MPFPHLNAIDRRACPKVKESTMIAHAHPRARDLRPDIHRLILRHGRASVTWALIRALLLPRRRRPRPPDPYHLSPHMRRDIGLPPAPPHVPRYYELR